MRFPMSIKKQENNNTITTKARYWVAVGYLENMREDWKEEISFLLQNPFAYCIHDKDSTSKDGEDRKHHVHILLAFPNTTTYKSAMHCFSGLNKDGCIAFNTCQKVQNVRFMYNYLIHDTEDCKKKHKHIYDEKERITGNNFDIGCYEQLSLVEKKTMRREIADLIYLKDFTNYLDLYMEVVNNFSAEYEDIFCANSGHFERLLKANYLKKLKKTLQDS